MLECLMCGGNRLKEVDGPVLLYRCLDCGAHMDLEEDDVPKRQQKTRMRKGPWDE